MNPTSTSRTDEKGLVTSRRATMTLAIAGAVSVVARSRRTIAAPRTADKDGVMPTDRGSNAAGIRKPTGAPAPQLQDLKAVGPQGQIRAIYHHQNRFEVVTADGRNTVFHETDLRIKIDTSDHGPMAGSPVILPGGMMGDRVTVFFASPAEVGSLIKYQS